MQDINKYYIKVASFFAVLLIAIIGIVFLVKSGIVKDEPISTSSEEAIKIKYEDFLPSQVESDPPPLERDPLLVIVSEKTPLRNDFEPTLSEVENNIKLDSRAAEKFTEMAAAAEKEDLHLYICSGYRSVERQAELFANKVSRVEKTGKTRQEAVETAKTEVAYPGTSEHHTGLAVDIVADDYMELDEKFGETPEGRWLAENAHRFGFVLRYPPDKKDITGIIFEPWHYRYVGIEHAQYIKEHSLCLEEYVEIKYGV